MDEASELAIDLRCTNGEIDLIVPIGLSAAFCGLPGLMPVAAATLSLLACRNVLRRSSFATASSAEAVRASSV